MNADLERLITLQNIENDLRTAQAGHSEIPKLRAAVEARLAVERGRLDAAREGLAASQKERRTLEGSLQDLETKRSKYKGQLMEVKTNKEYTAVLHEIEGVERDVRAVEDRILQEMERAEGLAREVKEEEAAFRSVEERTRSEMADLDKRQSALETQVRSLTTHRSEAATAVPQPLLELFLRVARLRGTGLSEAKDGMCAACHVKVRPQMYVDLKRRDTIIQCPSCSRILHYVDPPPPAEARA